MKNTLDYMLGISEGSVEIAFPSEILVKYQFKNKIYISHYILHDRVDDDAPDGVNLE